MATVHLKRWMVSNTLLKENGILNLIFNIFIAEAVTNQGRHIITSSIGMFETFLGDAVPFTTSGELFNYIKNILMEYKRNDYDNAIDLSIFEFDSNIYENCIQRLYKK